METVRATETPTKRSRCERPALFPRLHLRGCAHVGREPVIFGKVWIHGKGRVYIGERVQLGGGDAPVELHAGPGAEIIIGDDVTIEGGTSIEALESVEIGDRSRIGSFCKILDNHFHLLAGDRNRHPPSAPVVIEADAVIGNRSIVLPGARVPHRADLRAGSVVRGRPNTSAPSGEPPTAEPSLPSPDGRERPGLLRRLRADPVQAARSVVALARARALFWSCESGERVYAFGHVKVVNDGTVRLGDRVTFLGGMLPSELVCWPGASLAIGGQTVFNYGGSIEAHASITIGRRCMFASRVRICDCSEGSPQAIVIGDDVWLAHGVTLSPGVTIGDGSVVSAGSVVTRNVPPGSLAIGSPARIMSLALVTRKEKPCA
jgi:acetyltransferase-like isoleucine patch superfamily enzyme